MHQSFFLINIKKKGRHTKCDDLVFSFAKENERQFEVSNSL